MLGGHPVPLLVASILQAAIGSGWFGRNLDLARPEARVAAPQNTPLTCNAEICPRTLYAHLAVQQMEFLRLYPGRKNLRARPLEFQAVSDC
jgi:hypothetical protein